MARCDKEGYVPVVAMDDADDLEHNTLHQPAHKHELWQRWRTRLMPPVIFLQFVAIIVLLLRHPAPRPPSSPGSTHFLYCEFNDLLAHPYLSPTTLQRLPKKPWRTS